ncbi:hypothetical protein EON68_01750, partial [archaeon]
MRWQRRLAARVHHGRRAAWRALGDAPRVRCCVHATRPDPASRTTSVRAHTHTRAAPWWRRAAMFRERTPAHDGWWVEIFCSPQPAATAGCCQPPTLRDADLLARGLLSVCHTSIMTAIVPGSKRRASGEPAASVVTLYMEGLPYTSTEDDIRSFFDVAPLDIRAPKYQDSGRLMGYAHVDFGTAADVEAALAKDGNYLGGRFISVLRAKPSSSSGDANMAYSTTTRPASCTTLFVKGLPYDADEDTVKSAFSRFGSVASVRLGRWNHTARLKGFGYVQFEHGTSAEA